MGKGEGSGSGSGSGGGNPIEHVVVLMLENRSFDHMLGYLKKINPNVDGLNGDETNYYDPSDPSKGSVTVSPDSPYVTSVDPNHSIDGTKDEIWGGMDEVNPPPMNGFVMEYGTHNSTDNGAEIMKCFTPLTAPAINTMAQEFCVFDQFHASVPGPTQPNRMYIHSATSHGAGTNVDDLIVLGYPQLSIYKNLYDNGHDFRIYYSDFPITLIMRDLRTLEFLPKIQQITNFYTDCAKGTLPPYSFLEPRWFHFGQWQASDEHPPHDIHYGEYLIASCYAAIRASPLWEKTLFIVTYDEHGGFYDHVPTPLDGVPNPDGLVSTDPDFNFDRLGVRVPVTMASPWIKQGSVISDPLEDEKPTQYSCFEHSSICASVKKMLNIPNFLTLRDAWAATFNDVIVQLDSPRTDCPNQLPVPGDQSNYKRWLETEFLPETEENVKLGKVLNSNDPLTDLQYEILLIANGLTGGKHDIYQLKTEHEGALFVRQQWKEYQEMLMEQSNNNNNNNN